MKKKVRMDANKKIQGNGEIRYKQSVNWQVFSLFVRLRYGLIILKRDGIAICMRCKYDHFRMRKNSVTMNGIKNDLLHRKN